MTLINFLAFGIGIATFCVSCFDLMWFYRYKFVTALKQHLALCVICPGLYGLFNGLSAVLFRATLFYTSVMAVIRLLYVYGYMRLLISIANAHGYGGREEDLAIVGKLFDAYKIPPQKHLPPLICCTFARSFTPSSTWLRKCLRICETYIAITVGLLILKQTFTSYDMDTHKRGDRCTNYCPCHTQVETYVGVVEIALVFYGLSGILPVLFTMQEIVLPNKKDIAILRKKMFLFAMPFLAVQNLIFGHLPIKPCNAWHIRVLVQAVECFLFAVCAHRAFVPMFLWEFPAPPPPKGAELEQLSHAFKYVLTVEEVQAKYKPVQKNGVVVDSP